MSTLIACTGGRFQTFNSCAKGDDGNRIFDGVAIPASPNIGYADSYTNAPGQWCLWWRTSAAAAYVRWTSATFGTIDAAVTSVWLKLGSAGTGTSGTPVIFHVDSAAAVARVNLVYNAATGQLTLAMPGEGTSAVASVTAALNTWFRLDLRVDYSGARVADQYLADWQINGIHQPQVASGTGKTPTTVGAVGVGNDAAQTAYQFFDAWALSATPGDYPLGSHSIKLLQQPTVQEPGLPALPEPQLSGTAANWKVFTNNGGSLFTYSPGLGSIPIPVPTGVLCSGIIQAVAATGDYMRVPMFDLIEYWHGYQLRLGEFVTGGRLIFYGWAADTNPANLEIRLWNGTDEQVLYPLGDPNFDNSTTALATVCRMIPVGMIDTQAKLDALELRFGWSSDATPSIGVAAACIELAVSQTDATSVQFLQYAAGFR